MHQSNTSFPTRDASGTGRFGNIHEFTFDGQLQYLAKKIMNVSHTHFSKFFMTFVDLINSLFTQ